MISSWSSFDKARFTRTLNLAQMGLGNASMRQQAISNNIANVDTPHYKRKMITFESELNRVIAQEEKKPVPFLTTHKNHIPVETPRHYLDVSPNILEEYDSNYRNDKNNVDIEKEVGDMVKNNMHFNASSIIVASSFKRFKSVVTA